mgnify:FL=1
MCAKPVFEGRHVSQSSEPPCSPSVMLRPLMAALLLSGSSAGANTLGGLVVPARTGRMAAECDCGWTAQYACPTSGEPGTVGYADDDGSECYRHCCPSSPSPPYSCDCSWTEVHACPGSMPGTAERPSERFAENDGSPCFAFCCLRSPPSPPPKLPPPSPSPAPPNGLNDFQLNQEALDEKGDPLDVSLIITVISTVLAFILLMIMLCLLRKSAADEEAKELSLQLPGHQGFMGTMAIDEPRTGV